LTCAANGSTAFDASIETSDDVAFVAGRRLLLKRINGERRTILRTGPMAKETHPQTMESQQELLEVWGFDLLAHVEAMLRHARQYNQEVKQLRSHLGKGQTTDQVPLDAVLQHVKELQRSSTLFSQTLGEIVAALELVKTGRRRRAP
jgi:diaminopimelate decarboxylase